MEVQRAPRPGGSLGSGAGPRTRRVLGAALSALLAVAGAAVVADLRDPAAFRDRAPLPSCGSTVLTGSGTVPPEAAACLDRAVGSARGAELRVVTVTVEGDDVVRYFRAVPGGGVVVLVDSTEDAFGDRGWSQLDCPAPVSLRELGRCTSTGL